MEIIESKINITTLEPVSDIPRTFLQFEAYKEDEDVIIGQKKIFQLVPMTTSRGAPYFRKVPEWVDDVIINVDNIESVEYPDSVEEGEE